MNKQYTDFLIKISVIIIVAIFLAVILIKRFLYFRPSSHFYNTQEPYKVINHGHLHGWLLENPQSEKIILFCHGNRGNVSHCEYKITALKNLGYSVLVFDYSGYGKSSKVPSEQQLYDDASAMTALLRQQYRVENIILYGESMGGPIATYAARRYSISTLILEGPLPSVKIYVDYKHKFFNWLSFLFPEFDTYSYLHGYKGRSLLLHSPTDEVIPYQSTLHLQEIVTKHIPIDGSHSNAIIPWGEVKNFIEQV